eukprot:TRINITY_DN11265_c0_g1_i3.p1 TRINITY_DN11265_c0_g1~~TRINITY_DN11265_c0_g1_i3.p1  ORF type:complete len:272 (-),score=59.75 TRINITY_DN11265_c0_g1_i3:311-1126(-)
MMSDTWLCSPELVCSTFLFLLLYFLSAKFRYLVKFGYLFISYTLVTPFIALILLPWARNPTNGALVAKIMKPINKLVGIRWSIEGKENLECPEGAVVILNHQSVLDLMALFEIWPHLKKAAPIAKSSILYSTGFFGICCWLIGTVFINRSNKNSRDAVNSAGKEAMANGTKVMIFPEGTRNASKGLSMLPFKKGAFHVAIAGKAPIIPVVVSEYNFLDSRDWRFDTGSAVIRVLPAIQTTNYQREDIDELIEKTRNQMVEALQELANKKDQ